MNTLEIPKFWQPAIEGNDFSTCQKNWVFFDRGGKLFCIHSCHPHHSIYELDGDRVAMHYSTLGPRWPYGEIRGGTVPVEHEGRLLRFFHSATRQGIGTVEHRYYIGAYVMEPEPPFAVLAVSRKPILYGCEVDAMKSAERKACPFWKANVVFASGILVQDGHWLLSVGVNDSGIALAKITPDRLNL